MKNRLAGISSRPVTGISQAEASSAPGRNISGSLPSGRMIYTGSKGRTFALSAAFAAPPALVSFRKQEHYITGTTPLQENFPRAGSSERQEKRGLPARRAAAVNNLI